MSEGRTRKAPRKDRPVPHSGTVIAQTENAEDELKSDTSLVDDVEVLAPTIDLLGEAGDSVVQAEPTETRLARPSDPVSLFLSEARRYTRLSEEEEKTLVAEAQQGHHDSARRLVLHNLRLVVSIAYQYRQAWTNILDLFQEGSLGLVEAVKRWEPALGARFGSYAAYWIRAFILRFLLTNARLIHVGNTRAGRKLFFRLERERQRLLAAGVEVTPKLLAAKLDVDEEALDEVSQHLASRELSLSPPTTPSEDTPSLSERIATSESSPEEQASQNQMSTAIRQMVEQFDATLTDPREQTLWREYLAAEEPASLSTLGERFGVSKQRMGQIVDRLKKRFEAQLVGELGPEVRTAWLGEKKR